MNATALKVNTPTSGDITNDDTSGLQNIWGESGDTYFFRKTFQVPSDSRSAWIRIFADTGYELFINDRFIAAINEWNNTRDYEISTFLNEGENILAVKAFNNGGHRGLAVALCLDGNIILYSDETWLCFAEQRWGWKTTDFDDSAWSFARILDLEQSGTLQWNGKPGDGEVPKMPILECSLFFSEEVTKCTDAPLYNAGEPEILFDDQVSQILGASYFDSQKLYPSQVTHPLRVYEPFESGKTPESFQTQSGTSNISLMTIQKGKSIVIDFGGEVVGFLRLHTLSSSPVYLKLMYGENLSECLFSPSRDRLLYRMITEQVSIESGSQQWESRSRQGFRFVRIEVEESESHFVLQAAEVKNSIYKVPYSGYFCCSDDLLNHIWENGRRTLHLCMQEYYLDGVKRDRLLWTGDTRLEALINYYCFADTELFMYCWKKLAEVQYPDGAIPSQYGLGAPVLWDYVAWWIIAFDDYYTHTGDIDFPRSMKEQILRTIGWLVSKSDSDGLIDVPANRTEKWMCVLNKQTGKDWHMNFLFYRSLVVVATLMKEMCETELAEHYSSLAKRTLSALNQQNSRNDFGHYASASIDGFEIIQSLFKKHKASEALGFIRENWKSMVEAGYDTLSEGSGKGALRNIYDPEKPSEWTSFCHGWSAGPIYSLQSETLGIKPLTPGFSKFEIKPQLGDLEWAKGAVPSPVGTIAASFEKKNGSIQGTFLLPQKACAKIGLPYENKNCGKVVLDGKFKKGIVDNEYIWIETDQPGVHTIGLSSS